MNILIVGSDGTIGRALLGENFTQDITVIGTTKRRERINEGKIFCDIAVGKIETPIKFDAAVLCAGITSGEECENFPAKTRQVNVIGTLNLAANLRREGCRLIYCSNDKVYTGAIAKIPESMPPNPLSEYGKQKAEVEKELLKMDGAVLRFTKVVSSMSMPIFSKWKKSWENGLVIEAFQDLLLSPISLKQVVQVFKAILLSSSKGLFQLSASDDISYYKAACIALDCMGLPQHLAVASSMPTHLAAFYKPYAYSSLDTSRIENEFGISTFSSEEIIRATFQEYLK